MNDNNVLFVERYAAAESLKNFWTRMASTYGCIGVVLTREKLTIEPHWYVKWLIVVLGLDLCHEIPVISIRGAMESGKWGGYGKVEVHFVTTDGKHRRILLYLKKHREFVDTIKIAIG